MISKLFSSVLCMVLSPLLVAQQVCHADEPAPGTSPEESLFAYRSSMDVEDFTDGIFESRDSSDLQNSLPSVPFELPVELIPVDAEAWANATVGSTLTFRVVLHVIEEHHHSKYADAYAGTFVEAKVIRMRESKSRAHRGVKEPRVQEILVGKSTKFDLEGSPRRHARLNSIPKSLIVWPPKVAFMAVFLPFEFVALGIACSMGCDL
ncbi:MAG: hypothetical protein ACLPLZ_04400 [Terracidiphilus sp.]